MPNIQDYMEWYNQTLENAEKYKEEIEQLAKREASCTEAFDAINGLRIDVAGCLDCKRLIESMDKSIESSGASMDGQPFGETSNVVRDAVDKEVQENTVTPHSLLCWCEKRLDDVEKEALGANAEHQKDIEKYAEARRVVLDAHGIDDPKTNDATMLLHQQEPDAQHYIAAISNLSLEGFNMEPDKVKVILEDSINKEINKSVAVDVNAVHTALKSETDAMIKESMETVKDDSIRRVMEEVDAKYGENVVERQETKDMEASKKDDGLDL